MTRQKLRFRTYCSGDEIKLAKLLTQCLIGKYSSNNVLKLFENKPNNCFIAENENHEIVACLFMVWRELHIGDGVFVKVGGISGICVHPNYRRQGIMTLLLSKAHKYIREKGGVLSCLFTSKETYPEAYKLYRKTGFVDALKLVSLKRNNSLVSSAFRFFKCKIVFLMKQNIRIVEKDEISKLVFLQTKVLRDNVGYMKRREDNLIMRLSRHNLKLQDIVCFGEQTLRGYIIKSGGFRSCKLLEACFNPSDAEIREKVWEYLRMLSRSTLNFLFVWPMNSFLTETIEGENYDEKVFMIKVLNISDFLSNVLQLFRIGLTDLFSKHKSKDIMIKVDRFGKIINIVLTIDDKTLCEFHLPVGLLLQLIFNYPQSRDKLKRELAPKGLPDDIIDSLFPKRKCHISPIDSF